MITKSVFQQLIAVRAEFFEILTEEECVIDEQQMNMDWLHSSLTFVALNFARGPFRYALSCPGGSRIAIKKDEVYMRLLSVTGGTWEAHFSEVEDARHFLRQFILDANKVRNERKFS